MWKRIKPELGHLYIEEVDTLKASAGRLMAPDTEPTDEELALVMGEARELAVQRRAKADAWVADRLKEGAQFARENARTPPARGAR